MKSAEFRQLINIVEGRFRKDDIEEYVPEDSTLNDLRSKYVPDWELLDHRTLRAVYMAKDHRQAADFVNWINDLSERLDHFAKVTQDVAEVTVETTTSDVKGITILDFNLALQIDYYARDNDIEQQRMQGNFDEAAE